MWPIINKIKRRLKYVTQYWCNLSAGREKKNATFGKVWAVNRLRGILIYLKNGLEQICTK